jgi:hypothetical protein
MVRATLALGALLAAACCGKGAKDAGSAGDPGKPTFTLFALAEVRGQIGPCGCTSDPLGDLSRTAKLVADARAAGPVLVVDAGSLLYSKSPVPPALDAQEELKADLLAATYKSDLQVTAVGLGPADLAKGPGEVRLPREALNAPEGAKLPLDPPRVVEVGGTKVGIFGAIVPGAVKGLDVADPVPLAKAAVAKLHADGAAVVVALIQAKTAAEAITLVKSIGDGVDFAIAGLGDNAPEPDHVGKAQKIGGTNAWLVVPANRGQVLARLDITVRGGAAWTDAIGPGAARDRIADDRRQVEAADAELARFAKDPTADKAFVAQKQRARDDVAAEIKQLEAHPTVPPAEGNYFTLDQIRINKLLACSAKVQDAINQFDHAAGAANVKRAADTPVPQPPAGQATYVGMDACSDCHADEDAFWKKTVHASAWKTLVDRGQEYDLDCIGCHVTGWDKPGGSNLAHNDKLRDVQCETCHGPGSIHVAKGGTEKPAAIKLAPEPTLCANQCHTKEHSDTFQYEAYLRDITGPGHAAKVREKLGDGPTGHSLRTAALDKAGHALGAGCTR